MRTASRLEKSGSCCARMRPRQNPIYPFFLILLASALGRAAVSWGWRGAASFASRILCSSFSAGSSSGSCSTNSPRKALARRDGVSIAARACAAFQRASIRSAQVNKPSTRRTMTFPLAPTKLINPQVLLHFHSTPVFGGVLTRRWHREPGGEPG